jgi:2,3-dihydroxyphenylpropionate 1,2-dioxygenase
MYCYKKEPDCHHKVIEAFEEQAEAIRGFDPELVILFGSDHFNGFFVDAMPAFCIGAAATAVGDIGGHAGQLDVPEADAFACVDFLREAGIDVACSHAMTVDHGFSQVLYRATGCLDAYPVLPVFINAINKPYVPFRRSRLLGEAMAGFIEKIDRRVLVLASGGLSHHPVPIYPEYGTAEEPTVTHYQLHGSTDSSEGLSRAAWLDRLEQLHHMAADWVLDGVITPEMIRLNPEFDRRFLALLQTGDLAVFDDWSAGQVIEEAGIGAMEIHTWIAAAAAALPHLANPITQDLYEPSIEYGIGVGLVHA